MCFSYHDIGDIPFSNGKTLKELLIYDGLSYWWCCKPALIADFWKNDNARFGILPKLHFYCSKYFGFVEDIVDVIANFCVRISDIEFQSNIMTDNGEQNKKIIFRASTSRWIVSKDMHNITLPYYDGIISHLPKTLIPEMIITDVPTPDVFRKYRMISKKCKFKVRASTLYYSPETRSRVSASRRFFRSIWDEIKSDSKWFECISPVVGLDTVTLRQKMEYFLLCTCPLTARYNYLTESMLQKEKPTGIMLTGEQSLIGTGWVFLAKKYNVPLIGLQHGILLDDVKDNTYLQHNKDDINLNMRLQSHPLPDLTLVYGTADYDMLVNRAYYPPNRVKITGNPKYDVVPYYLTSRKEILQKYNIQAENKKIILWATQSHALSMDEALIYMRVIFSAVSSSQNLKLLIKPHPAEGEDMMQLYHEEQKKYPDLDVTYFTGTDNTSELISISDLVIVRNSTVGQEAIAFQKPLVVLDVSENPDAGMFVKEGVAVGVYNPDNLSTAICELLDDDTCISTAREEYISKYLYKVDGQSAKRCVDCLLSLINQ